MNKEKIVEELNEWARARFGSLCRVVNDHDLTLLVNGKHVAWFGDFKKDEFKFTYITDDNETNVWLIKEDIIKEFYDKVIELMSEYESKYTVQVLPNEYGFLYRRSNNLNDVVVTDLSSYAFPKKWGYFTQSEIDELKKRDDLAIDWNKAIIKKSK